MELHATGRRTANQKRSVKIVVTGPFGAGKTSLIQTISEVAVLSTERDVSDGHRPEKATTTVAMDFGRVTIDTDLVLYLFGTPGQRRFDFMWEILAEGMLGFVLLVDAESDDSVDEAAQMVGFFRDIAEVPYVVGLNKSDGLPANSAESFRHRLGLPDHVRIVPCDVRKRDSGKDLLLQLLLAILEEVEAASAAV